MKVHHGKHKTYSKDSKPLINFLSKNKYIKKIVLGEAKNIKTRSAKSGEIKKIKLCEFGFKICIFTENGVRDIFVITNISKERFIYILKTGGFYDTRKSKKRTQSTF